MPKYMDDIIDKAWDAVKNAVGSSSIVESTTVNDDVAGLTPASAANQSCNHCIGWFLETNRLSRRLEECREENNGYVKLITKLSDENEALRRRIGD